MCGISGYIGKSPLKKQQIIDTISVMKNRGPDFQDHISFSNGDFFVTLIHSRLSIIDLSDAGHQPMVSKNKRYILKFLGLIFIIFGLWTLGLAIFDLNIGFYVKFPP